MSAERGGVEIEGARFAFPGAEFVLEVPRFSVAPGELVALVGPSGSGKTTLLDLVAGIRLPERGRVRTDGFEWARNEERARRRFRRTRIGLVFQEFELLGHLSVLENVLLAWHLERGHSAARARDERPRERAEELARSAGIAHLLSRKPARLSQGERQRVAICRALVSEPTVVLADEPTGNLDARTAGAVMDLFVSEVRARGATLVVVTHDASLLARFDSVRAMEEITAPGVGEEAT